MSEPLYIHNARIWTADPARPWAHSIEIRDGRVAGLDVPPSRDCRQINAARRVATPGLIDSHLHLVTGAQMLDRLDLSNVNSRAGFEAAVEQHAARLLPGQWLLAFGWSEENWGGALPDQSWLAAAGDRPVVCHRIDMHAALVNDAVLAMCDLRHDPPGGRIVRHAHTGAPSGLLLEAAAWTLVNPLIPTPSDARKRHAVLRAQAALNARGLTTIGSMEYLADVTGVLLPLRSQLTLRCRVTALDRGWPMSFDAARSIPGDDTLALIGCKAFIDGTLGSRTARMLDDYHDQPGNRGLLVELAAQGNLDAWARAVAAAGLSPSMHAIGDHAVRLALDIVDQLDPACRPRIEHAQHVHQRDLPRFANRIASMQPLHKTDDARGMQQRLGDARCASAFPFRDLQRHGAILAFGSDWPVVSFDPLQGIRAAVSGLDAHSRRFHPEQNLSIQAALLAFTRHAAFALGLDDAGVLRPGALGDMVMFAPENDPFLANWDTSPPRIATTIVAGRVVYDASDHGPAPITSPNPGQDFSHAPR